MYAITRVGVEDIVPSQPHSSLSNTSKGCRFVPDFVWEDDVVSREIAVKYLDELFQEEQAPPDQSVQEVEESGKRSPVDQEAEDPPNVPIELLSESQEALQQSQIEIFMKTVFESEEELSERAFLLGLDPIRPVAQAIGGYRPLIACLGGMPQRKKKKMKPNGRSPGPVTRRVPRSVAIAPDKMVVDLTWREDGRLLGSATVAKRWYTNAAYDVDPAVGGAAINGFNTWSTFYSFNRVLSYHVEMVFANVEVVPITLDFVHLNVDPGTVGTSYPQWATSAYGSTYILGSYSGQGSYTYRATHSIRQIVGDRTPITSERYVGSSSANPTDTTYFGVAARDLITSMTNGVNYVLRMTLRVEFYDRKNIDDI